MRYTGLVSDTEAFTVRIHHVHSGAEVQIEGYWLA
jgi:hypothetical protein